MNTRPITVALLVLAALSTTSELLAQRRRTDDPASSGRGAPSGSGSRNDGGERGVRREGGAGSGEARPASPRSEARPESGKIARARARSREVQARTRHGGGVVYGGAVWVGGCYSCYYWGGYHGRWGWYDGGWWYPARRPRPYHAPDEYQGDHEEAYEEEHEEEYEDEDRGQGYQEYPYAENTTGESFGQRRGGRGGYGALSGFWFEDQGSTTQAGQVQLEGVYRVLRLDAGYGYYREPLANRVDAFQTARFSVGIQPALGPGAYLIAGVGARGLWLDDGSAAGGIEGTLGLQLLPFKPLGLSVTGRLAGMTWSGQDRWAMSEVNTTGSIFLGRIELQGGWHWMKLEGSPAFGGPMVGTRIWF